MTPSLRPRPAATGALLVAALTLSPGLSAQTSAPEPLAPRAIAAASAPAVVAIAALDEAGRPLGQGTGFLVSGDGVLVTNFHVIARAAALTVETYDGATHREVYLLGADRARDVAVLQVPARGAAHLRLGRDADLAVGDPVYVMGNPLGMERTFSDGMLSARRDVRGTRLLQVSAPLSPGSSGGPVMNAAGEVVGMAAATVLEGQNLNLAIPARYIRPLLDAPGEPRRFSAAALGGQGRHFARADLRPADAARGEERWLAESRAQVETAARVLGQRGFHLVGDVETAYGEQGVPGLFAVELEAGRLYGVMAACDADCADVDLMVVGPGERVMGEDVLPDDTPVVVFEAPVAGRYFVGVNLADCATRVCGYAVGVMTR